MDLDHLHGLVDAWRQDDQAIGLLAIILIVIIVLVLFGFITFSFRAG